ncbi:MAG: hypothetical protein LBG58_10845 [Planctomycetaceae bacterium]|nr:hypothetical protein [Planctomycetaceae bacterium]
MPIGNSESDSIGQFVFLTGLETDCRRKTGASRLSPTQPFGERLPTNRMTNLLNNYKISRVKHAY